MSGFTLLFGYIEPSITFGSGIYAYVAPEKFGKFFLPFVTKSLSGNDREVKFFLRNFAAVCIFGAGALYAVFGYSSYKKLKVPRQIKNVFLIFTAVGDLAVVLANVLALRGIPRSEWNWTALLGSGVFSLFLAGSRIAYMSKDDEPKQIVN